MSRFRKPRRGRERTLAYSGRRRSASPLRREPLPSPHRRRRSPSPRRRRSPSPCRRSTPPRERHRERSPLEPYRGDAFYSKRGNPSSLDPCKDRTRPCAHLLECGHLVLTEKPNEPCGWTCKHIGEKQKPDSVLPEPPIINKDVAKEMVERGEMPFHTGRTGIEQVWAPFYCDTCAAMELEAIIPAHYTSLEAQDLRTRLCDERAEQDGKGVVSRPCHITSEI